MAPLVLPILPVETFIRYQDMIGIRPSSGERGEATKLPQIYANRFGWPEMVAQIAGIYNRLSPQDKADCVIGAGNYGELAPLISWERSTVCRMRSAATTIIGIGDRARNPVRFCW